MWQAVKRASAQNLFGIQLTISINVLFDLSAIFILLRTFWNGEFMLYAVISKVFFKHIRAKLPSIVGTKTLHTSPEGLFNRTFPLTKTLEHIRLSLDMYTHTRIKFCCLLMSQTILLHLETSTSSFHTHRCESIH